MQNQDTSPSKRPLSPSYLTPLTSISPQKKTRQEIIEKEVFETNGTEKVEAWNAIANTAFYNISSVEAITLYPQSFTRYSNNCYINTTLIILCFTPFFFELVNGEFSKLVSREGVVGARNKMPLVSKLLELLNEFKCEKSTKKSEDGKRLLYPSSVGTVTERIPAYIQDDVIYWKDQVVERTIPCGVVNNNSFLDYIQKALHPFSRHEQNDTEEFSSQLLNKLHEEFTGTCRIDSLLSSPITQLFCGIFENEHSCKCGKRVKFENFLSLRLSLPPSEKKEIYLQDCILNSGHRDTCSGCEQPISSLLFVHRTPNILVLLLERFEGKLNKEKGIWESSKREDFVSFEHTMTLNPSLFSSNSPDKNEEYELFAVANHFAQESQDGGHYTAHIKFKGEWFHVDDNKEPAKVCSSSKLDVEGTVVTKHAYILFYKRKELDQVAKVNDLQNSPHRNCTPSQDVTLNRYTNWKEGEIETRSPTVPVYSPLQRPFADLAVRSPPFSEMDPGFLEQTLHVKSSQVLPILSEDLSHISGENKTSQEEIRKQYSLTSLSNPKGPIFEGSQSSEDPNQHSDKNPPSQSSTQNHQSKEACGRVCFLFSFR